MSGSGITVKVCRMCAVAKPASEFSPEKRVKDGLQSSCKSCRKAYYLLDKDNAIRRASAYYVDNKAAVLTRMKEYTKQNTEMLRDRKARYRAANKEAIAAKEASFRANNKEKLAAKGAAKYAARREHYAAKRALYVAANPGIGLAQRAKRRASKLNRTPGWLTDLDRTNMKRCYELASIYCRLFGVPVHVDHVIPLQGKSVSGLHVPWNLRILPSVENLRKNAKWLEVDALSPTLTFEDTIAHRASELLLSG